MAKDKKIKPKKEVTKQDKKLAVKGSFLDIMKAAAKHADKHSVKK
jgi:hypothetical protein